MLYATIILIAKEIVISI